MRIDDAVGTLKRYDRVAENAELSVCFVHLGKSRRNSASWVVLVVFPATWTFVTRTYGVHSVLNASCVAVETQ